MATIPNQSSVPKVLAEFDDGGRVKAGRCQDRAVDATEELVTFTYRTRERSADLATRSSETPARVGKGREIVSRI